jgi:hypothetical protein
MLKLQYHNILMTVKKKYYMWYIHLVFQLIARPYNRIQSAENRWAGRQIRRNSALRALICLFCAYGNRLS